MIKYEIKTGDKAVNMRARNMRDTLLKPFLKGMNCQQPGCKGRNTIIEFYQDGSYARYKISACCTFFHDRIKEKLNSGHQYLTK